MACVFENKITTSIHANTHADPFVTEKPVEETF